MGTTEFRKYSDIERISNPEVEEIKNYPNEIVYVEEKVDGGNGSFWWDNKLNKIIFASRNKTFEDEGAGNFQISVDFIKAAIGDGTKLNPDYIYYFEHMIKHTIKYDLVKTPRALGFDIHIKSNNTYLGFEDKVKEFSRIGIPMVRLVMTCKMSDIQIDSPDVIPNSIYYSGKAEGIVIKNYNHLNKYGRPLFAKIVSEQFKELQAPKDKSSKEYQDYRDSAELVEKYATEARIRKQILRLVNEEQKSLDRTLMKFLPVYIIKDILKEESDDVSRCDILYIKFMRTKISKLCLDVLDREIYDKKAKE